MKTFYIAAGGVVFDSLGRVLVLDRPSRGEIRLPKGHVERGEVPLEAAVRETAEEAGYVDLELLGDLGTLTVEFEFDGEHITRDESYFAFRLATDRRAVRRPKDARQFEPMWLAPDEAIRRLSYEAEREWVRRATRAFASAVRRAADA